MDKERTVNQVTDANYWPVRAAKFVSMGRYSRAVEICKEYLPSYPEILSGRIIYARAFYYAGQIESAKEEFHHVLQLDPDNLVALKYLSDISFSQGDELVAMANYNRILQLDPGCGGLKSELKKNKIERTKTITITRGSEPAGQTEAPPLRDIPFYTETIGDLYLAQGHPRLAVKVFEALNNSGNIPRLAEKISRARQIVKEKEK